VDAPNFDVFHHNNADPCFPFESHSELLPAASQTPCVTFRLCQIISKFQHVTCMQYNAMVYKIGYIERRCMNCCDVGALYIS
jgi:hypothetical protein